MGFMVPLYTRWRETPTILSVESTNHPVWDIYFPGVTICNNNKVVAHKLKKVLNEKP